MAKIEESESWNKPGTIRIDGIAHPSGAWTLKGVDDPIEVMGASVSVALQAFVEAFVDLHPERAGSKSDILVRIPDAADPARCLVCQPLPGNPTECIKGGFCCQQRGCPDCKFTFPAALPHETLPDG